MKIYCIVKLPHSNNHITTKTAMISLTWFSKFNNSIFDFLSVRLIVAHVPPFGRKRDAWFTIYFSIMVNSLYGFVISPVKSGMFATSRASSSIVKRTINISNFLIRLSFSFPPRNHVVSQFPSMVPALSS